MPKHYVCTGGCGGVSAKPGTCAALSCARYGKPLELCDCTDGTHGWVKDEDEALKELEEKYEEE